MAEPDADRRAALIAAAVDGSLTDQERPEFDLLRSTDASVDLEVADLRSAIAALSAVHGGWDDAAPRPALRERVLGIDTGETADREPGRAAPPAEAIHAVRAPSADHSRVRQDRPSGARRWLLGLAAAACVLIGAGGVIAVQAGTPASAPPGTLGAVERVEFTGERAGVAIDGALVAHTWGTETVLEIDGLDVSDRYSVVLVSRSGDDIESGTFLGSAVTIDCRMNAAVLRADVVGVEIQDAAGEVVAAASVPDTS